MSERALQLFHFDTAPTLNMSKILSTSHTSKKPQKISKKPFKTQFWLARKARLTSNFLVMEPLSFFVSIALPPALCQATSQRSAARPLGPRRWRRRPPLRRVEQEGGVISHQNENTTSKKYDEIWQKKAKRTIRSIVEVCWSHWSFIGLEMETGLGANFWTDRPVRLCMRYDLSCLLGVCVCVCGHYVLQGGFHDPISPSGAWITSQPHTSDILSCKAVLKHGFKWITHSLLAFVALLRVGLRLLFTSNVFPPWWSALWDRCLKAPRLVRRHPRTPGVGSASTPPAPWTTRPSAGIPPPKWLLWKGVFWCAKQQQRPTATFNSFK